MYAIVIIAGQQYKVEKDQKIFVHRLADKEGDSVSFDEVLLIDNDSSVMVGKPTIKGAMITGKVISHPKGDKVQVFKKKRRKGYQVLRGHRQYLTEIHIQNIIETGATKEVKPKAATKADKTAPAKKATPTAKAAPAKKAAPEKKATPTAKAAPDKKAAPATKAAAPQKKAAKKKSVADANKTTAKKPAAKPAAKKSTGTTSDKTDKE